MEFRKYMHLERFCNDSYYEGWSSKYIPRLLQETFYDLIKEESWDFVKEFKFPTINFKTLQTLCILRIKEIRPELF